MTTNSFPSLDPAAIAATRDALHAYARVMGGWTASSRQKRKHWWHASLRPSLNGLTTGVMCGDVNAEIELDCAGNQLHVRTSTGKSVDVSLAGQSSADVAGNIEHALVSAGVDADFAPGEKFLSNTSYPEYSPEQAAVLHEALAFVAKAMEDFRAGIREETSPIQLWSHHFDLSLLWLPGQKISGQDPADEENSDKQMNFGFTFGDEGIPEPYFYVTAYPLPDALAETKLPAGATWQSDGFEGAVLLYRDLVEMPDPHDSLLELWKQLLAAGQLHLATDTMQGHIL